MSAAITPTIVRRLLICYAAYEIVMQCPLAPRRFRVPLTIAKVARLASSRFCGRILARSASRDNRVRRARAVLTTKLFRGPHTVNAGLDAVDFYLGPPFADPHAQRGRFVLTPEVACRVLMCLAAHEIRALEVPTAPPLTIHKLSDHTVNRALFQSLAREASNPTRLAKAERCVRIFMHAQKAGGAS